MANPLRISRENDFGDPSTVAASSAFSSLPAANVKDADIQKIWRATGNSGEYIILDTGRTLTLEVACAINTNIRSTDTIRWRSSTSDATVTSSLSYDSGSISAGLDPVYKKLIHVLPSAVSYRYLRLDVTTAETYVEIGRMQAGQLWAPSRNVSLVTPPEEIPADHTRTTYSIGQNRYDDIRARQRGYRFTLRGIPTAEKQSQIDEINRLRGMGRELLVIFDKDSQNPGRDSVWGHLNQMLHPRRMADTSDLWECEFEIMERI